MFAPIESAERTSCTPTVQTSKLAHSATDRCSASARPTERRYTSSSRNAPTEGGSADGMNSRPQVQRPTPNAQRPTPNAHEPLRRPRHPQLQHQRRHRQPRPVPGDSLHPGGVRRRGPAHRRRGRRADPHPRAHARGHAVLRDRGLPRDHRGDPGRGRRRDHQLLDRGHRGAAGQAHRLPARAAPRRGRAEHELDELREVLAAAQGLRVQGRVREQLRHDHRA